MNWILLEEKTLAYQYIKSGKALSKEIFQQPHPPAVKSYCWWSRGAGRSGLGVAAVEIDGVGFMITRGVVILIISPLLAPFRGLLTHLAGLRAWRLWRLGPSFGQPRGEYGKESRRQLEYGYKLWETKGMETSVWSRDDDDGEKY